MGYIFFTRRFSRYYYGLWVLRFFSLETKPHNMPLVLHYFFVLANQHYNDIICMHEENTLFPPILLLYWLNKKRDFVWSTLMRWCYNITSLNWYLLADVHVVIIIQCSCMVMWIGREWFFSWFVDGVDTLVHEDDDMYCMMIMMKMMMLFAIRTKEILSSTLCFYSIFFAVVKKGFPPFLLFLWRAMMVSVALLFSLAFSLFLVLEWSYM